MLIPWQDLSPETLENLIESLCYVKAPIMVNMSVHLNRKCRRQTPATVRRSGAGMVGAAETVNIMPRSQFRE